MHSRCRWFIPTVIVFSHRMFPLLSSYWGLSRWGVSGLCPLSTPFCQSSWKPLLGTRAEHMWRFTRFMVFLKIWWFWRLFEFLVCFCWLRYMGYFSDICLKGPAGPWFFSITQGAHEIRELVNFDSAPWRNSFVRRGDLSVDGDDGF